MMLTILTILFVVVLAVLLAKGLDILFDKLYGEKEG